MGSKSLRRIGQNTEPKAKNGDELYRLSSADLRNGAKAMASFFCHGFGVAKQVRLERIVRRQC